MILDKALILKGVAGASAIVGVGLVTHAGGLFSSEETRRLNSINKKLNILGLEHCLLNEKNFKQDTKIYSKEDCKLITKDQFKKIKFSVLDENENVDGLEDDQTAILKIEEKGDPKIPKFTFTTLPSSTITVTGKNHGKITIKQNEEFEEKKGKLSRVISDDLKTKLGEYNNKLGTLNIPQSCKFNDDTGETTIECEITQNEFKKIKFSNRAENVELIVKGWNGQDKIKLKIEEKVGETKGLKYTFKGMTSKITVFGDKSKGKIVIDTGKDYEFKEDNTKLTKSSNSQSNLSTFNGNLGTLNIPLECRFDEAENDTSVECDISQEDLKAINFSNKGDGALTVKNWPSSENIKLKVEKETSNQEMRLFFQGLSTDLIILGESSKGKIIIKNDKKFKFDNGKLIKISSDETLKTRLQNYNEKLGKLNLPDDCKFDEYESDKTMECDITKDQFKNINFWNKQEGQPLTIQEESGFNSVKLEAKEESTNKLKIIIKNTDKAVKITGGSYSFNLRKRNDDEFEIRKEKLAQVRKMKDNEEIAGLICTYTGDGNTGTCKSKNGTIKVSSNGADDCKGDVLVTDCTSNSCFNFSEYEDGYNQTTKFTYTGTETTGSGANASLKLENNATYHTINKGTEKYLSKKNK